MVEITAIDGQHLTIFEHQFPSEELAALGGYNISHHLLDRS